MVFQKRLAEAVRYALVDVQGMRVTRTGVNPQPACNSNAEKVLHALNMLRRVCVLTTYGFLNLYHFFTSIEHALASKPDCDCGFSFLYVSILVLKHLLKN